MSWYQVCTSQRAGRVTHHAGDNEQVAKDEYRRVADRIVVGATIELLCDGKLVPTYKFTRET